MAKFYAAREMKIQSCLIAKGTEIGEGEIADGVNAGTFKPVKDFEGVVELGHIIPRVADGRIVTDKPAADAPATKAKSTKSSNNTNPKAASK